MLLHFVPSKECFKEFRFNPNQNNIRLDWFRKNVNSSVSAELKDGKKYYMFSRSLFLLFKYSLQFKDQPNPYYNYEILSDLRSIENNEVLKEHLNHKNVLDAIKLLKLWFHKRNLNKVNNFS